MNTPTIEDQLELEKNMTALGIRKYTRNVVQNIAENRGSENNYATKLIKEFVLPLSEALSAWVAGKEATRYGAQRKLIALVEPHAAAYIALTVLFNSIMNNPSLVATCRQIGTHIEDEARFSRFKAMNQDSVNKVITQAKERGSTDYRYLHRVLTHMANDFNDQWNPWTVPEKVRVGALMIQRIRDTFDLIEVTPGSSKRKPSTIAATAETVAWIQQSVEHAALLRPVRLPCIIPPAEWDSYVDGGYHSVRMRSTFQLIKTRYKVQRELAKSLDLHEPRKAISTLQNTPWQVNRDVHDVLVEVWDKNLRVGLPGSQPLVPLPCPFDKSVDIEQLSESEREIFYRWKYDARQVYAAEKDRVSRCLQVMSVLRTAAEFKNRERIWFPIQADFRGRMYTATAGFSPQGPNFGKGLLRFAQGKPLGDGEFWFLVHGANLLGYDKASYEDRVEYISRLTPELVRAANDPISYRETWGQADKPWQFLAWLFEFKRYQDEGSSMISHLPIALDGSCNGLQHFSALLLDEVGGAATNLVPMDKPADIYQRVADVVKSKLKVMDAPLAAQWLALGVDRKLVKPPVMTLPYGSTRQTCTNSLVAGALGKDASFFENPFQAAVFLTPIVWDSIGEVVVAARAAMKWLRDSASILTKNADHIEWITPTGFPMAQRETKISITRVETVLDGICRLSTGSETNQIDNRHQQSGVSPNFVHSMDASHLCRTVIAGAAEGIESFACIHDDFGTHASDTEKLHRVLREQFVGMYQVDQLDLFKKQQEERTGVKLLNLPPRGTLDIRKVLDSRYFFG